MLTLFVENLTVIDCSILHPERGLVGESWIVDVSLEGELDEQGMMMDFANVKRLLKKAIDAGIDHRLVVPRHCPALEVEEDSKARHTLSYRFSEGKLHHSAPAQAVVVLEAEQVDVLSVAAWVKEKVMAIVPPNVKDAHIRLRNEMMDGPSYHYSHGLKKHDGNCQRIAHGHRSKIVIEENGHRSPYWEQYWAECFRDIYIGTMQDVVNRTSHDNVRYLHFAYGAQQGYFTLTLPTSRCYLIPTDSTVEHIASYIASELRKRQPDHEFRVRAYEGVAKGAEVRS